MSLTVVKGMQSEIFVPITPPSVWTPVTKELKDMSIALATAAGVHKKTQERFNLAGDFTWRKIENTVPSSELMVSHGGYDNSDVNKDINCMFPIDRIHELAAEGFIRACAPVHAGFMGGGGDQEAFTNSTGPEIAKKLKEENIDILKIYFCPHNEKDHCHCKKPKPGMIEQAKKDFLIDMNNSIYIGDSQVDYLLAKHFNLTFYGINYNGDNVKSYRSILEISKQIKKIQNK